VVAVAAAHGMADTLGGFWCRLSALGRRLLSDRMGARLGGACAHDDASPTVSRQHLLSFQSRAPLLPAPLRLPAAFSTRILCDRQSDLRGKSDRVLDLPPVRDRHVPARAALRRASRGPGRGILLRLLPASRSELAPPAHARRTLSPAGAAARRALVCL